MTRSKRTLSSLKRTSSGSGGLLSTVINKAVDLLPFEAHLPGYNYCGPGTRLSKRLSRGDRPINGLDEACKLHDIAYASHSDSDSRRRADKELAERAWQRFKSPDSSLSEKLSAWAVTNTMKAKSSIGSGRRKSKRGKKRSKSSNTGSGFYLRPYNKRGSGKVSKKKSTSGGGRKKRASKKKFDPDQSINQSRVDLLRKIITYS